MESSTIPSASTRTDVWDSFNDTSLTIQEAASYLILFKVGQGLRRYYLPIIVVIGLVGNVTSFIIMMKQHNRRISCCTYMAALAVTDSVVLLIVAEYWTLEFNRPYIPIQCNVFVWLLQVVYVSGTLFLVAMTGDRFIAVTYPLKAYALTTPRRARITVGCIVGGTMIYTIPYFFTAQWFPESRICVSIGRQDLLSRCYGWITMFLTSFLPFLSLLTLNSLIIRAVRKRNRQDVLKLSSSETNSKVSSRQERENQLVKMLLLATFTFLVLTMPYVVRNATASLWDKEASAQHYAGYMFLVHASGELYFTNNAVNFYLYCLGGQKFRQDARDLYCCCKYCSKDESFDGRDESHDAREESYATITTDDFTKL